MPLTHFSCLFFVSPKWSWATCSSCCPICSPWERRVYSTSLEYSTLHDLHSSRWLQNSSRAGDRGGPFARPLDWSLSPPRRARGPGRFSPRPRRPRAPAKPLRRREDWSRERRVLVLTCFPINFSGLTRAAPYRHSFRLTVPSAWLRWDFLRRLSFHSQVQKVHSPNLMKENV